MKPLRVLVYPHAMEIGGSQLNAIELAAAVRDRGHRVWVYGPEGPLVERITGAGLPFIRATDHRLRPSPGIAHDLRRHVVDLGIDVVHGYEWPPILEAYAATWGLRGPVAVGTVMSMGVAPFIPRWMPLTVGTVELHRRCREGRPGDTVLLEPPVDTRLNSSGCTGTQSTVFARPPQTQQIVVVSRLATELKLEGILASIRAVGQLAARRRVRLTIVGDGPAREAVRAAVDTVNRTHGYPVVVMTGEVPDPREAYDCADVCLGMGGSALRALAYEKPLIVLGEGGFSEILTPHSLPQFLSHGWYGVGDLTAEEADARLVDQLDRLLGDEDARRRLGELGRALVQDRYSLDSAAETQMALYTRAVQDIRSSAREALDGTRATVGLARYKLGRRLDRVRGIHVVDDFNAVRNPAGAAAARQIGFSR